ncbi:MAG: FHA domain-containing protein [Myxococcota bacterium]
MRCPHCHNDNPPHLTICDWCGASLTASPAQESSTPKRAAAVSNPGEKRKTMYEPSSPPPTPGSTPRPPADDFFGSPPPPRPAPRDPDDPFAQSIRPQPPPQPAPRQAAPRQPAPRQPAPQPSTPPQPAPRQPAPVNVGRPASRTIIENPARAQGRTLRGALFIFSGDSADGVIAPLYEGRNSLGRADDRDIILEDGRISSEHGFLFLRKDRHTYVDTSTNGSRIDGKVVYGEQVEVRSGSVLEVGGLRLIVVTIPPEAIQG